MAPVPLVLLVGANGQVGHEVVRAAAREPSLALKALGRAELDITDAGAVTDTVARCDPALVVNCAAYTAVDLAEKEPDRALAVNRDGTAHLAGACASRDIPLVHLSTDYVFDGEKEGAYREGDPASPTGVYGQSKWLGEVALRQRLPRHLILRVSWVFGAHGNNFVKTMLRLGRERDELRVVADQHGCPTAAAHIARTLWDLAGRIVASEPVAWGTYHYCGRPATTWHAFAREIIRQGREEGLVDHPVAVHPIRTSDYPTPARRPANSVLDCSRIEEVFSIRPGSWQEGVREVVHQVGLNR